MKDIRTGYVRTKEYPSTFDEPLIVYGSAAADFPGMTKVWLTTEEPKEEITE